VTRIALHIADRALRETIAERLAGAPGITIVGAADHPESLRRLLESAAVDLVLAGSVPDENPSTAELTPREREVLALLADGASNKVIARRLGISFHTAKFHVATILAKLDADSRTEAVAIAARRGLVML
jgi:DNA-binding NarL/FixJ family response regulator